jgi:hypothetical protein
MDGNRLLVEASGPYRLRIIDARGVTVFSRTGIGSEGRELPSLPAGVYQIGVVTEGDREFVPLRVR